MEVGAKELTFIERSGLLFGFLFGCLQTCLWYFYQAVWVLPVGGFVVRLSGGVIIVRGVGPCSDVCGHAFWNVYQVAWVFPVGGFVASFS